jgi:hypothetical protein
MASSERTARDLGGAAAGSRSPAAPVLNAALALLAVPLALLAGGCARQPREFDVSPQAAEEERVPAPGPVAANLAGNWEFNPRESDQPGQNRGGGGGGGRGGMGGGRRGGIGGGMGGRGGYPGSGGMPGTGGDYPGSAGMPGRPSGGGGGRSGGGGGGNGGRDSSMAGGVAWRLHVAQTDSTLTITRANGNALTLFFDGRTVYAADARGESQNQASGRWNRKRFEVRRSLADGRTLTESYELSRDSTRLTVRTRVSGGDRSQYAPPEMRRVYDRVADPGPAATPKPAQQPVTPPGSTQRIGTVPGYGPVLGTVSSGGGWQ